VFVFDSLEVFLCLWITPEKKHRGFREGPLQMNVSDLGTGSAVLFPGRALLELDQSRVGGKLLNSFKPGNIVDLLEDRHGKDFPDA
jgi:hypothetical protein